MGIDAVGIGTHFNTAIIAALTDAFLDDGFSEDDVAAILGGNFLRVLREVLPASGRADSSRRSELPGLNYDPELQ
ncbi:MAG: hypothetical protein HN406_03530 [Lentisphaerae bacterium]|jgi:microsomal dipeptidase-like Zn-dependent dipeptidase|nr:hypothetical protein [Lentisphaerota bacterium]